MPPSRHLSQYEQSHPKMFINMLGAKHFSNYKCPWIALTSRLGIYLMMLSYFQTSQMYHILLKHKPLIVDFMGYPKCYPQNSSKDKCVYNVSMKRFQLFLYFNFLTQPIGHGKLGTQIRIWGTQDDMSYDKKNRFHKVISNI